MTLYIPIFYPSDLMLFQTLKIWLGALRCYFDPLSEVVLYIYSITFYFFNTLNCEYIWENGTSVKHLLENQS